jgi:hypothetical protein
VGTSVARYVETDELFAALECIGVSFGSRAAVAGPLAATGGAGVEMPHPISLGA